MYYEISNTNLPLILTDYLLTFDKKRVVLGGKQVTISYTKIMGKRERERDSTQELTLLSPGEGSCISTYGNPHPYTNTTPGFVLYRFLSYRT
jgi:hypothetical protein